VGTTIAVTGCVSVDSIFVFITANNLQIYV